MNPIFASSAAVACLLTACAKPSPDTSVSVTDVIDNIHSWDGAVVNVRGWLGKCQGLDCRIFPTADDMRTVEKGHYDSKAWMEAMDRGLSIGSEPSFDQAATPMQFRFVIIQARVSDKCRRPGIFCLDRASELSPISVYQASADKDK